MQKILYDAYLSELFSIAFFSTLADKPSNASERDKWQCLADLERHAATLLKTWLEQNGQDCVTVDPVMDSKGQQAATAWLALEWQQLMALLEPWIEEYTLKYRTIADEAPPEHHDICEMTAVHEEAIFYFVQAERAGDKNSLKDVRQFMVNYPTR